MVHREGLTATLARLITGRLPHPNPTKLDFSESYRIKDYHSTARPIDFYYYNVPLDSNHSVPKLVAQFPTIQAVRTGATYVQDWPSAEADSLSCSPIDGSNKYTEEAITCLVPIWAGNSVEDGKEISLMSHVSTGILEKNKHYSFLLELINRFKSATIEGTRSSVIAGGFYQTEGGNMSEGYIQLTRLLAIATFRNLGIDTVIFPPKLEFDGVTHVFFDTLKRKLHILETGHSTGIKRPFKFSHMDNELARLSQPR